MAERVTSPLEPSADRDAVRLAALEKVDVARGAVTRAGAVFNTALGEVAKAPRADKVEVSDAVRTAFDDLCHAKRALSDLEALVTGSGRERPVTPGQ